MVRQTELAVVLVAVDSEFELEPVDSAVAEQAAAVEREHFLLGSDYYSDSDS